MMSKVIRWGVKEVGKGPSLFELEIRKQSGATQHRKEMGGLCGEKLITIDQ